MAPHTATIKQGAWSTTFCDCCAQPGGYGLCCTTGCCSCCTYGNNIQQLEPSEVMCGGNQCGACCCYCMLGGALPAITAIFLGVPMPVTLTCFIHAPARQAIKRKYGIQPETDCCDDWCITIWCAPCALCQDSRELSLRVKAAAAPQPVMMVPVVMQPGMQPGMPPMYPPQPVAYPPQ